jgi:hypothetical protein
MAFRIEHRIGVTASAEVIWELISNLDGWAGWNPLYPDAKGKLAIGETLRITEALPDKPPRSITPVVVDWEPQAQILWRLDSGLMSRSVRYLEIESLSETGCIFANGAFFHGMLGEQAAKSARRAIQAGYDALGEAVKRIAEQRYREQLGDADRAHNG